MSGYHDSSWRLPDSEKAPDAPKRTRWQVHLGPPTTFRESFAQLPEPYRSTFLRVGAAMLDLDDPAVFENACRLADSVADVP